MTALDERRQAVDVHSIPEQWRLMPYYIPKARFNDPDFLKLECERMFPRTWLYACREEELPEVGSYVEFEVAGESILLVRATSTTINAFFNNCRHRGTQLARGRGRIGNIRCPFHAWQYGLDGACQYVHDRSDFPDLDDEYLRLRDARVDTWGGFVFINLDSDAEPLLEYLSPLPERLGVYNIDQMRTTWHKTIIMRCNWKTALEAFSESYHVPGTHPQLLRSGDHNIRPASRKELLDDPSYAPSEVLGHNVACYRVSPKDPEKPRYSAKERMVAITEYHIKELRALSTERDLIAARELETMDVPPGRFTNEAYQNLLVKYARAEGLEWPELDPSVRRAADGNYTVFPNMIFLVRQGVLLGYRSRPNKLDPESCIFDVFGLEQFPEGKEPQPVREFFEDWHDGDVGEILTQDFQNLEAVAIGMRSRAFEGAVLSSRQEKCVFQRQELIDDYLFGSEAAT